MKETLKIMRDEFLCLFGYKKPVVTKEPVFSIDDKAELKPYKVRLNIVVIGEIDLYDGVYKFKPNQRQIRYINDHFDDREFNEEQLTKILAKVKKLNEDSHGI